MRTEHELREELVRFGRLTYERRLLVAMDGNLSARLPSGDLLCTRAGCHKGFLRDEDILLVRPDGTVKRGEGRPTSEIFMHLACYRERPDVHAVIHAHPPLCVAFTIASVSMDRCVLPEVVLTLGTIPTAPYKTTGTDDLAAQIGGYAREYDAILMDTHGALTVGCDLLEAFCRLETMEHTALILSTAQGLGGIKNLPSEEAVKLRRLGLSRYGGPPAAVARKDLPGADLPVGGPRPVPAPASAEPTPMRMLRVTAAPLSSLGQIQRQLREQREQAAGEPRDGELEGMVVEELVRLLGEPS
jgi:L-fuculose-phosphate aldolase